MAFVKSISELSHQSLRETWWNASEIHAALNDFYQSSITSVLDDCEFEVHSRHISGNNFLSHLDMCISCKPLSTLLAPEIWEKFAYRLYLGLHLDDEKSNQVFFYNWFQFQEGFQRDYFHKTPKTKQLKSALENKGWTFEFVDDIWLVRLFKPADEIDFAKPTWKRDLKKFYEESLGQFSETVLKTEDWLD